MVIQAKATAKQKSHDTKHLQIKQENRRIYPVVFEVFLPDIRFLYLIHNELIAVQK
jgi:hypothetical protein